MVEFKDLLNRIWVNFRDKKEWRVLWSPQMWKLLLLLGAGIILLVYAGSWVNTQPKSGDTGTHSTLNEGNVQQNNVLSVTEKEIEGRLEQILREVDGAGNVRVTVTLAAGPESIYAQNNSKQQRTIEEKDNQGGTRTTTEINDQGNLVLIQAVSGGNEEPVVIKSTRPEIAGVLVLAEGAKDPEIREKLARAVETVLNIPPHKVAVLSKESW